jgi:hypothetical protein
MLKPKTNTLFIFNGLFTFNRYIHLLIIKQCSNDYNNKLYHRFFLSIVNYNNNLKLSKSISFIQPIHLCKNQKTSLGGINL